MLPQAARSWYHKYDAFRAVPKEIAEATWFGACMTVCGAMLCLVLAICETSAFLASKPQTQIVIDSNQDAQLRINFDVTMLDMSCDNVAVGVWDAFGTEKMNISRNVQKQRIDHKGSRKGRPYSDEEIAELEFSNSSFTPEEIAELDADWGSSSDVFKHDNFQAVVNAHDFTMVNFYADWCPHCRRFAPIWMTFESAINNGQEQAKDADGNAVNVRVLMINCVDFEAACQEQKINHFPSVRLYKRGAKDGNFFEHQGERNLDEMYRFLREKVGESHLHVGATYHEIFSEGCRISGHVLAYRVPGTVHFQAMHSADRTLNLAFTNVSHVVHHFSFGETPRQAIKALPAEYRRHVNPMDGITYAVDKFHKAPQHFIKVVHTRFEGNGIRSYQQTHQWSVRTVKRNTIPQAKFSYDLAPVEVIVTRGDRRWYDYVTQLFAITGGAFSVMSILVGGMHFSAVQLKNALGKSL